jgi:hypothetical protein
MASFTLELGMNKLAFASAIAIFFAGPALAQDTAAVGPSPSVLSVDDVVGQCEAVAAELESARGLCYGSTESFIAGLGTSLNDELLTELISRLVRIAEIDVDCNVLDGEVAQAIRYAGGFFEEDELQVRVFEIAQTVEDCVVTNLAAIPPVAATVS